ncbi:AcrR family transcriptional regulator [Desulfitispora alkaliphila]|uniref:TetR/AcrR family transcriptional regulator n=1 Tax=Desulfitispora alkaliphila TaxID=622674 RepID=UPI003D1AC01C
MSRVSRKIDILNAASKVVSEKGIFNLTLEAVAKEAGLSKGGLLYHYPSKIALVEGMVEHLTTSYDTKISEQAKAESGDKGRWLRAYVDVTFNKAYENKDMNYGLMAAKAVDEELLDPIRNLYIKWQEHIENEGVDPIEATIIRLATDGIWLAEIFDLYNIDDETKNEIYQRLIEWIEEE